MELIATETYIRYFDNIPCSWYGVLGSNISAICPTINSEYCQTSCGAILMSFLNIKVNFGEHVFKFVKASFTVASVISFDSPILEIDAKFISSIIKWPPAWSSKFLVSSFDNQSCTKHKCGKWVEQSLNSCGNIPPKRSWSLSAVCRRNLIGRSANSSWE